VPPTATPEPVPTADFVTYENAEMGLTVQHPADWAVQDFFVLLLATQEELFDAPGAIQEGAVMVIAADTTESLGNTDPVALVSEAVEQFDLSDDATIVDGPNPVVIQGQDAAIARIEGTSEETNQALVGLVVVIINGNQAAVGFGYTPQESEAEYLPVIEAVLNTIVVSEPIETEPDTTDNPPTTEGATPLAVGDNFASNLAENSPQDFIFTGQAGSPVTIDVEPLSDELDLVVEIFDVNLDSLMRVDDAFTGEAEQVIFTPPADGVYFVRVEDFFGTAGDFEITVAAGGVEVSTDLARLESGLLVQGRLDGDPIQYLFTGIAGLPSTIFLNPEEDLDATLTVLGTDGAVLVEEVDDGFSGEAEAITFTPETDGDYVLVVDAFSQVQGGYSLFLIDPDAAFTAEGVVPEDGEQTYRVCVPANAFLVVFADPEEDFDNVVNFNGPGGDQLIDQTDNGFSGEAEAVILTEGVTTDTAYVVVVSVSGFAGQGGNFDIIITSTSPEGVVIDGC
jgi:hypothetical protein